MEPAYNLSGKTIVITGATSGIGLATAQALAARGAAVIGVGRSAERCAEAKKAIQNAHPGAVAVFSIADLSSQQQVRSLAQAIQAHADVLSNGKIDVLINNAASVSTWFTATEDGYELQFAVNHLAPFLLTHLLLPSLQAAPGARVLTVSSASHRGTKIRWDDVMMRRGYQTLSAYKQSKLANVMFSYELNRRLGPGSTVRAYAVDPGLVNTAIGEKGTARWMRWIWKMRRSGGVDPDRGAATAIYLASETSLPHPDEVYWKDCRPVSPSAYAQRAEEAARLWELSEHLCGFEAEMPPAPSTPFFGGAGRPPA